MGESAIRETLASGSVWSSRPAGSTLRPHPRRGGLLAASSQRTGWGFWSFEQVGGSLAETNRLLSYVVLRTIVGTRLGHCLLYQPAYYLRHPVDRSGLAGWPREHGGVAGWPPSFVSHHSDVEIFRSISA
jgi:hypothetical protein